MQKHRVFPPQGFAGIDGEAEPKQVKNTVNETSFSGKRPQSVQLVLPEEILKPSAES